jgi:hypothetical protein
MSKDAVSFGSWLADQEYKYTEHGDTAWLLDMLGNSLELATEDATGKSLDSEHIKQTLQLMQHTPRLLRFILRALTLLHSTRTDPADKIAGVKMLLQEVAGDCIGSDNWRQVAAAVSKRQAEE